MNSWKTTIYFPCVKSKLHFKKITVFFPGGSGGKEPACRAGDSGWEDPLEKRMATCSSIPAWRIPWTAEPVRLQSMESQRVRHDWATHTFTFQKQKSVKSLATGYSTENLLKKLRQPDSHICFCSRSVVICCFGWSMWRKSGLPQRHGWKGRNILIAFWERCGLSLIIYQSSARIFS